MARAPASARRFLALPLAALPLLSLAAPLAVAQDNNYWSLQYGPVAELLGGIVVGSAIDLSSTYYNPGGLALAEDPAFLLSLNTFQLEQVSLDAPPPSIDLSSSRFGSAPSLIAGKLPDGWIGSSRLAWSVLTRQEFKLRINERRIGGLLGPGEGRSGEEALVDQNLNETWVGLTWSQRLGETTALGATVYGIYRGQPSHRSWTASSMPVSASSTSSAPGSRPTAPSPRTSRPPPPSRVSRTAWRAGTSTT